MLNNAPDGTPVTPIDNPSTVQTPSEGITNPIRQTEETPLGENKNHNILD